MNAVQLSIEEMTTADWDSVSQIYQEGIATGEATFEIAVPDQDEWDGSHLKSCRLVARSGQYVVGWAALSPVSDRCAYQGVAEVSVYVASKARGEGVGEALLGALIAASENAGIWTLQAGMFVENVAKDIQEDI